MENAGGTEMGTLNNVNNGDRRDSREPKHSGLQPLERLDYVKTGFLSEFSLTGMQFILTGRWIVK